jgi:hypothetical protein
MPQPLPTVHARLTQTASTCSPLTSDTPHGMRCVICFDEMGEWKSGGKGQPVDQPLLCAAPLKPRPHLVKVLSWFGGFFRRVRFALACRTEPLVPLYAISTSLYSAVETQSAVNGWNIIATLRSRGRRARGTGLPTSGRPMDPNRHRRLSSSSWDNRGV